jgi:hypothetical protein
MVRTFMIAAASAAILVFSSMAFAQGQFGSGAEARAMLERAIVDSRRMRPRRLKSSIRATPDSGIAIYTCSVSR